MPKRVPWRRVKSNRNYNFEEVAELLGVSVGTVRRWTRIEGMPFLNEQRPFLILGWQLKEFLKYREAKNGQKMNPTEFFCLTCKAPREPLGMMVDYIPITDNRARLAGLCPCCSGVCNRFVAARLKDKLTEIFDLQINCSEEA